MDRLVEKLESLATKVIENLEEKPFKTLILGLLAIYLIAKVLKMARGAKDYK